MNKKIQYIIFFTLFLILNTSYAFSNDKTTQTSNHIDAVLVVDTSNSMNGNDPNHIAIEGVKLFIDMMEYNGSRVSIIGFNGEITFEIPLTEINTFEDKTRLLSQLDTITYVGYTDIGLALKEAESNMYTVQNKNNKQMVIMFTDGFVELDGKTDRTEQQSKNEIEQVILGAKSKYPIYTIGLNKNDRVDEALIKRISKETNAKNYMTSDPKDLPRIFNELFAKHIKSNIINIGTIKSDGENYNLIDINIPNSSVSEANIILLSKQQLIDAKLAGPDGVYKDLMSNDNIYFSKSAMYSVIKIIKPEQGNWTLSIKGVKDDEVKINLLYNYYINIEGFIATKNIKLGDTIEIVGKITDENDTIIDDSLLSSFNGELEVYDFNDNLLETLTMNIKGNVLSYDYKLPDKTPKMKFIIKAAGSGFYRESDPIILDIKEPVSIKDKKYLFTFPFIKNAIKVDILKIVTGAKQAEQNYKLTSVDNYKDTSSSYDYKIESNVDASFNATVTTNNNNITLVENKGFLKLISSNFFKIKSTRVDIDYKEPTGILKESSFEVTTIPLLFILFLVLILFGFPKAIKTLEKRGRILKGRIKYSIISDGIYGESKPAVELALFKGIVTVRQIIKDAEISKLNEVNKISFVQTKGKYSLDFTNNSSYTISTMAKLEKNFSLVQGNTITISNDDENIELKLTYIE